MTEVASSVLGAAVKAFEIAKAIRIAIKNRAKNPKEIESCFDRIQLIKDSFEEFYGDSFNFRRHTDYINDMEGDVNKLVEELQLLESKVNKLRTANKVRLELSKLTTMLDQLEPHMKRFSILLDHRQQFELLKAQLHLIQTKMQNNSESHSSENTNILAALHMIISMITAPPQLPGFDGNTQTDHSAHLASSLSSFPPSPGNTSLFSGDTSLSHDAIEDSEIAILANDFLDAETLGNIPPSDSDVIHKGIRHIRKSWQLAFEDIKYRKYRGENIKLGMGATSIVFKGYLKERDDAGELTGNNKISVAIKQIQKSVPSDLEEYEKYFLREIAISKNMQHDCIIKTYGGVWPNVSNSQSEITDQPQDEDEDEDEDADSEEQRHLRGSSYPLIIVELMKHNIDSALKQSSAFESVSNQLKVAINVAEGLNHLHLMNIVHRDIKPQNILLNVAGNSIQGSAKISDFGVSRKIRNENSMTYYATTKLQGTIVYMPPEILLEKERSSRKSWDVWSFGILLCHICQTGVGSSRITPVNVKDLARSGELRRILEDWINQIEDPVLKYVVQQCTVFNPNDRIKISKVLSILKSGVIPNTLNRALKYLLLNDLWRSLPAFADEKWINVQQFKSMYAAQLNCNQLLDLEKMQIVGQQTLTSIVCYNPKELLFQIQTRLYDTDLAEESLVNQYINAISKRFKRPYMTSRSNYWMNSIVDYEIVSFSVAQTCCVTDDQTKFVAGTGNIHGKSYIMVSNIKTGFMEKKIAVTLPSTSDAISCIAATQGSKRIFCGSEKGKVQLYDFDSEQCVREQGASSRIHNVCVSAEGSTVIIRCSNELIIWDLRRKIPIHVHQSFTGDVHIINNDRNILCSSSKGLKVLNIEDGAVVNELELGYEVDHIKVGGSKSTIHKHQANTSSKGAFCVAANGSLCHVSLVILDTLSVAWRVNIDHPIGAISAPRYGKVALGLRNGGISLLDLTSGECIGSYYVGHRDHPWNSVQLVELLPEDQLISEDRDGYTYVWTPERVHKKNDTEEKKVGHIKGLAVSTGEFFIATGDDSGSLSVLDGNTCSKLFSVLVPQFFTGWEWSIAFNSTNKFVGYCNFGIKDETATVQAHLGIIDIQEKRVVVVTTVDSGAHPTGDKKFHVNDMVLKFVEDRLIVVRYKLSFESSYNFEALKMVSTGSRLSLQVVPCEPQWKDAVNSMKDTSLEDKICYRFRHVRKMQENTPGSILATLPYQRETRCPIYYNEETGTFIAGMVNNEIVLLKAWN